LNLGCQNFSLADRRFHDADDIADHFRASAEPEEGADGVS